MYFNKQADGQRFNTAHNATQRNIKKGNATMYYIEHRKIGYVVLETEDLETARAEKKALGRAFRIVDENGNEIK